MNTYFPGVAQSVIATLLVAVAGLLWRLSKNYRERQPFYPYKLTPKRRKALEASIWKGKAIIKVKPPHSPVPVPDIVSVEYKFETDGGHITAKVRYPNLADSSKDDQEDLTGGFCHPDYMMLTYNKENRGVHGFGAVIFKLDASLVRLQGLALGWNSDMEGIVVAELDVRSSV